MFATAQPDPETQQLCELVLVRPSGLRLLVAAQRRAWPQCVALSLASWTGERGGWILKAAPFLIPPGRALLQNANGDFFAGTPGPILRHAARRARDAASSTWNGARELAHWASDRVSCAWHRARHRARERAHRAGDFVHDTAHRSKLLLLMAAGTILRRLGYPHCNWFGKCMGRRT